VKTGQVKLVSPIPVPIPLSEKTATLVRITAGPRIVCDRTYGNYTILPCKPGQRYITMKIRSARCVAGTKDSRKEWEVKADEVAEDLAMECNSYIWGIGSDVTGEIIQGSDDDPTVETVRGFNGVFVADGEEPTEEELQKAEELLAASDEILTTRAHEDWDAYKEPKSIHDGWKKAAKRLGVTADWLYRVQNNPLCPHCGAKLLAATATVCATCGRDVAATNGHSGAKSKKGGRKAAAAA
jgi:hypothetical protein